MNGRIILVTGGARSGKSNYAEALASRSTKNVAYLATAIAFDEGMKDRIKKHQRSRPKEWTTFEGYKDLHILVPEIAKSHDIILLDCVTIMITNLMFEDPSIHWDKIGHDEIDKMEGFIQNQIMALMETVKKFNLTMIMVTNELGMGIVPEARLSRVFRDVAGRMNQIIGKVADEVIFTVSGIPMKIK